MPPSKKPSKREEALQRAVAELEIRLAEAEETLRAIREGEVDAVIVKGTRGEQVFSLVSTDSIYRLIVETMKEAAFTVTPEGVVLFCNAQFGQFVKRPPEQIVGRAIREFVRGDDQAAVSSLLATAQARSVRRRLVFQSTDGQALPAHVSATVLDEPAGPSICVVASDLRELENSTELIQQLRRQQRQLEAANQDLDAFASIASHDLQEPLRTVAGFLGLLRDRYAGQLDDKARGYIDHALDGATRMSALVSDVLEYSRVGSDARQPSQVDLAAVVRHVLADLQTATEESRATITVDALPSVTADAGQMRQLFQNLIGNALKFQAEGRRPEVHLGARRDAGHWVFQVRDNGIGIPPGQQDRIFEIFARLHDRAKYPGTGIGLAICKKIVARHAGRIWVESEPGRGTTVSFSVAAEP